MHSAEMKKSTRMRTEGRRTPIASEIVAPDRTKSKIIVASKVSNPNSKAILLCSLKYKFLLANLATRQNHQAEFEKDAYCGGKRHMVKKKLMKEDLNIADLAKSDDSDDIA